MRPLKPLRRLLLCLLSLPACVAAQQQDILLTGEVFSRKAQEIIVPLTPNFRASISALAPEGTRVKQGQVVVEFDGTEAAQRLEQLAETRRTEAAKAERDVAQLEKDLSDAEFQLEQAKVALALAKLKADVPEGLLGAIEYAENQLGREKAAKALDDAAEQLADKRKSLAERTRQERLDQKKYRNDKQFWQRMLDSFSIEARQSGFMIYGKQRWTRAKFQVGDTVRTSFHIAQIADTSDLAIRVWINSIDRPRIRTGSAVTIMLDALPDKSYTGQIESISDSGSKRPEWGKGLYFEAVVSFDTAKVPSLMPGMSALVEPAS